ncbi:DUF6538 domain-containing protein [Paracoccus lutimaris]|uniref:DUF6538 domain-containing protein n=1 Tax=Paracoccus lutimaris TaxID=1490030 RepID=A0A368YHT3_9RHOB|nr:hypothetical protein DFP89_1605 [Paracoccus lutimaris]
MKKITPILRGDTYYLRKRVPIRYASVEPKELVHISLATDSFDVARRKAPEVWAQMIEAWEAKIDGHDTDGDVRMKAARSLAQRRGYRYLDAPDVARLPLEDVLQRIESIMDKRGRLDMKEAEAALGLVPAPAMTVSQAFEKFYEVAGDRVVGKSQDQLRRHRAPRLKATTNFIEAIGNKQLADVTTDDMFAFRAKWMERVAAGEVKAESANKDFVYLSAMWRAVAQARRQRLKGHVDQCEGRRNDPQPETSGLGDEYRRNCFDSVHSHTLSGFVAALTAIMAAISTPLCAVSLSWTTSSPHSP